MSAPQPPTGPTKDQLLVGGAIYLTIVVLLLRINPGLAITLFAIGMLALAAYWVFRTTRGVREGLRRHNSNDFTDRVERRLLRCKHQENKFRDEADRIRASIRTLRDDIENSPNATPKEVERARATVKELQAEFNLRHTKALFFADCGTRLREILDRHRLHESIAARQAELRELRQTNYDSEPDVEEARYHLEQDSAQLEAITELSQEISTNFDAERAEELRERLESLRQDILRGPQPSPEKES